MNKIYLMNRINSMSSKLKMSGIKIETVNNKMESKAPLFYERILHDKAINNK